MRAHPSTHTHTGARSEAPKGRTRDVKACPSQESCFASLGTRRAHQMSAGRIEGQLSVRSSYFSPAGFCLPGVTSEGVEVTISVEDSWVSEASLLSFWCLRYIYEMSLREVSNFSCYLGARGSVVHHRVSTSRCVGVLSVLCLPIWFKNPETQGTFLNLLSDKQQPSSSLPPPRGAPAKRFSESLAHKQAPPAWTNGGTKRHRHCS